MALGYLEGSIAGVSLTGPGGDPLRASLIGRGALMSARAVNHRLSANGNLYTQSFPISAGILCGVKFENPPIDFINDLVAAVLTATDAEASFAVNVTDDIATYSFNAVVRGSDWLQMPDDKHTDPNTINGTVESLFLTA